MNRRGFTLVELLISIILMIILLSAITLIFLRTTETVAIAEARQQVYTNVRYAFDLMDNDAKGCLSFSSGQNRFIMQNMYSTAPGAMPTPGNGNHFKTAADRWTFRSTTTVGDSLMMCEITYELIPGDRAIGAGGATVAGNPDHKQTARTVRPLFTLIRRVRVLAPNGDPSVPFTDMPISATGATINDQELCHYVISFNLEYLSSTQAASHPKNLTFSQLQPSYFTPSDPLGNGTGINDSVGQIADPNGGPPVPTPLRVPAVRVTVVLVDDVGERQERVFQKVISIPMG